MKNIRIEKTRSRLSKIYRVFHNDKIVGYIHDYTEYNKGFSCEPSCFKSSISNYLGWDKDTKDEAIKSLVEADRKFKEKLEVI